MANLASLGKADEIPTNAANRIEALTNMQERHAKAVALDPLMIACVDALQAVGDETNMGRGCNELLARLVQLQAALLQPQVAGHTK